MAHPISMDAEGSDLGKGKIGGSLAVNKSSNKIGKGLRRGLAQPRPAPQMYKSEPSDFRSLVQQLTGTSPPVEPPPSAPKPVNARLQRIAPPPLRPTFSYPPRGQPQAQVRAPSLPSPPGNQEFNTMPFGSFSSLSKQGASPFPVSPLSFSPLPQLSPSDQVWLNSINGFESPASEQATKHEPGVGPILPRFSTPLSPRFSFPFGLSSPTGFPSPTGFGLGNLYSFSSNFTPTAALAMDANFSFPEPDLTMSPAESS